MALSEQQVSDRARRKHGDINHLTAIVGTFDTQGRRSDFATLEAAHPNLSFAPPEAQPEVRSVSPVRWLDEQGEQPRDDDDAPVADEAPDAGEDPSVDEEPAEEPPADADPAPTDTVADGEPEGDAEEPAPTPSDAPATPVSGPDDWESLEVGPLRELALSMGLTIAPTTNKLGLLKHIRAALDPSA